MKVVVTGGEGFIGTHLVKALYAAGHWPYNFDRRNGRDLYRAGELRAVLHNMRPTALIHLAAKVGRVHGEEGVRETVDMNVGVTAEVAKACADYGARMIYASSSEIYGDNGPVRVAEYGPYREPHNLYGLTKRQGEEVAQLYAPDGLTVWRICMPYGPNQPRAQPGRHAALSAFLQCAKDRRPIPFHEGAERSWCYITDATRAMVMTLDTPGGVFNIGRDDDPRSMLDVAILACELTGAPTSLIEPQEPKTSQTLVKRISTQKIRDLGWKPEVELRRGMQMTLEAM